MASWVDELNVVEALLEDEKDETERNVTSKVPAALGEVQHTTRPRQTSHAGSVYDAELQLSCGALRAWVTLHELSIAGAAHILKCAADKLEVFVSLPHEAPLPHWLSTRFKSVRWKKHSELVTRLGNTKPAASLKLGIAKLDIGVLTKRADKLECYVFGLDVRDLEYARFRPSVLGRPVGASVTHRPSGLQAFVNQHVKFEDNRRLAESRLAAKVSRWASILR